MAFLGSIGKFLGTSIKSIGRSVGPALQGALAGAQAGGLKGAVAGAGLGLTSSLVSGRGGPPAISPGSGIFSGVQTFGSQLAGPVFQQPQMFPVQQQQLPVVQVSTQQLTQSIFNLIMRLAMRLGIVIKNPNSVVQRGRSIIARLLRFARVNPGMTILSMLTTLGLTINEANELITWYTTHGKRRRRIKVTNVKALNRSVRRLEGFRRLSRRVESALANRSVGRSRSIARGRCRKCRSNPCKC